MTSYKKKSGKQKRERLPEIPEDDEIIFGADTEEVELAMIDLMSTVAERTIRASYINSRSNEQLSELGYSNIKTEMRNIQKLDKRIEELQGWLKKAWVFPETLTIKKQQGFQSTFDESLKFKPSYEQEKQTVARARSSSR